MMSRTERVALLARYYGAWRRAEAAKERYDGYERWLFGAEAVRALDTADELVRAGVVSREDTRAWRWPVDRSRPPTPDHLDVAQRLVHDSNEARAATTEALRAIWRARVKDGYPAEAADFDELLGWAGVDMATVGREARAATEGGGSSAP